MINFFIDRPVFAIVIAIFIMLVGGLAITTLPVQRYPDVAPPAVEIRANYPGASAETVSNTVTQVIEQQMTGVDNFLYMSSTSDSSGTATLKMTFEAGTDPDIAQVQVQNKLKLAEPLLPEAVQRQGISVTKSSASFLMVMAFVSSDGKFNKDDLADMIASMIKEPLGRIQGVGTVTIFGSGYAMRIWLNPQALFQYSLTVGDVVAAIREQNVEVTAGELGGLPAVEGQQLNANIKAQSLLQTPEQFGAILLKTNPDGSQVRLRDVSRIKLAGESANIITFFDNAPAAGLAISLAPGANALETSKLIKERIAELQPFFPKGVEVHYPYETAPFIQVSIEEVANTLFEAVVLVVLVMLVFLQSWRATLIPTIAVPVVLLGTFAVMGAAGFSINMLTMFGMVLAIGLLVDDAIVVVENVERVMHENHLTPIIATRVSMAQISGALVGIGVVLSAVFIPMAFFPGSTGVIYRQFSLTIVCAMVISVIVALILSPTLCARLLKPQQNEGGFKRLFGWFNRGLDQATHGYVAAVRHICHHVIIYMLVFLMITAGVAMLFTRLPSAFLPEEDQGILMVLFQLPTGSTQQRALKTLNKVDQYFLEQESVADIFSVAGFSFTGRAQNVGMAFVDLKPWHEREDESESVDALIQRANRALGGIILDGFTFTFNMPAIPELGNATGFDLQLQDRGGMGHEALLQAQNQFLKLASESPKMMRVRSNGLVDTPQYQLVIDREKARVLGVSLGALNQLLAVSWGSSYVNDFLHQGRVKRVYVQGDAPFRMLPSDLEHWYLRNNQGGMVQLSELIEGKWIYASPRLERYNGVPSREILGEPAPGYSSGEAMNEVERLIEQLPEGIGFSWTGLSYQERQSGAQAPMLYAISIVVVLLALAALYESWTIPFSIVLAIPLGLLGAVLAAMVRGLNNDVFFQVGILTTVGLTAKNAILVVEFAKELEAQGRGLMDATLEAARIRLRPILMTSLAFTMGVVPLAFSSGAGAASRIAIGTAVLGGMLSATFLAIFFIPLFYIFVRKITGGEKQREAE